MSTAKDPRPPYPNVPPPAGSKAGNAYTRFIPREELGSFASWQPGAIDRRGTSSATGTTAAAPSGPGAAAQDNPGSAPAPSAEDLQAQTAAARQAGYQDGYRDGMAALESFKQSFATQATAQVGALLAAFDQQFQALDQRLAEALTRCAVELARQVLRHELHTHPEQVARVAAEAVAAVLHSARHITVQVHPQDMPLVAEGAQDVLSARGARLQANVAVERGGVLVESDLGAIEARISARWAQAAAAFGGGADWSARPEERGSRSGTVVHQAHEARGGPRGSEAKEALRANSQLGALAALDSGDGNEGDEPTP